MYVGKKIFVGLESGGKSLMMTRESYENLYRNAREYKKTGVKRPIIGNMAWSQHFYDKAAQLGVEVRKWSHIGELPKLEECDLYIDELQTYFDSRTFADLPLDVRLWLSQSAKMGVEIVGATQDFGLVDKSFRRLCNQVYYVQKIVGSRRPKRTLSGSKFIWGLFIKWSLSPRSFEGEQIEMKSDSIFPSITFLHKEDIKMFNTQERVIMSDPPPLIKQVRICLEDGFTRTKYF